MKGAKYNSVLPVPDYSDILTNIQNIQSEEEAKLIDISSKITDKVADDENGSLIEAVATSSYLGYEDLAIEIAKRIDPTKIADEKHYTLLWDVANPRKAKTFEALIDLGFKGSAFSSEAQSRDVLYQILSQAVDKAQPDFYDADVRMIRKLIATGTIQGFTEASVIEETLRNIEENEDFPLRSLRNSNKLPVKEVDLELDTMPVTQSLTKRQNYKQFNTGKSLEATSTEENKGGCCIIL